MTERFTGQKGKVVDLDDALEGCERILADELADVPEKKLYMIGRIDEATESNRSRAEAQEQSP